MKKCLALLCVSFMLLIALTSCRQEAKRRLSGPQEDMVATVGSIPLTSQQVKEMFVQFFTGSEDPELALSETLGHLADQVTLYLGAVEKGLLNESEEDYRDAVARKQLVGMELLQKANPDGSPIEVSKEELEERLPPSFETMRIRILTVEDRGMAEKIRTQILGGASFADKARQFSMDPAASRGGMITTSLFRGDQTGTIFTTDVEEILFSFPEGSITPPIDTGLGWSIFEILERKPFTGEQIMASMEALRTEIRIVKAQNKRLEVQRSHPITIDNEVVKRFASDPASLKDNTVMATIEDLEIPLGEVRAFARWNGISPKTPEDWVQVINAMHMNLAYYVESVKRGMPTPPYISGAIRNARLKRIANRYSEWVKRQIPVTDEQLWQTYVEEISRKMDPAAAGYYALRELKAGSRESAEDAVRELDAGKPWEEVSGRFNIDESLGNLKEPLPIMVTSLPYEMYQAFDKIPLKSATSPIPHPDGTFSVFFVEDFEKGKIGAFSSLRDEVASWYRKKNHKQVMEQILEEGREKNPVRYVDRGALVEKAGKWLEEIAEMKKAPGSSTPHGSGGAGPVSPHGGGGVRPVFPHGQ